ncbi:MAG: PaaI family thioesterase [Anaerolineaceae bacterium]|nr:MAG: PaaI family thioesterase [Anaerolineaceae bacterium]
MRQLPEHGSCFICGSENPKGLGIRWHAGEDGSISTEVTLAMTEQGPPGHAHGGALAAILDEIMGTAAWQAGYMVMAANLNIDFRQPVPLGVPLQVTGSVTGQEGRKVYTRADIRLPNGQVATVGKGLFVEAKQMFASPEESEFVRWLPDSNQDDSQADR